MLFYLKITHEKALIKTAPQEADTSTFNRTGKAESYCFP